jgi:hypothetical protein
MIFFNLQKKIWILLRRVSCLYVAICYTITFLQVLVEEATSSFFTHLFVCSYLQEASGK